MLKKREVFYPQKREMLRNGNGRFGTIVVYIAAVMCLNGFVLLIPSTYGNDGTEPYWADVVEDDFYNWTITELLHSMDGGLMLASEPHNIFDNFTDESKIAYKENITIYASSGQVRQDKWLFPFGDDLDDAAYECIPTLDGGFAFTGKAKSWPTNDDDVWLVKVAPNGSKEWNKTFGGESGDDMGYGLIQNVDGSFVIIGETGTNSNGPSDAWVIKTDSDGNLLWEEKHGGAGLDEGRKIYATADGGYIFAGSQAENGAGDNYDVWLVKLDGSGNEQWSKKFNGPGDAASTDMAHYLCKSSDGGYVIAGETSRIVTTDEYSDVWLIKTNGNGDILWNRTFGGGGANMNHTGYHCLESSSGGFLISGYTSTIELEDIEQKAWLIRTDASGVMTWNETYRKNNHDSARSVLETTDGGFIVVGDAASMDGASAIWVWKTDSTGNFLFERTVGGFDDHGRSIVETPDGDFIISGYSMTYSMGGTDGVLMKMDSSGNFIHNRSMIVSTNLLSGTLPDTIEYFRYEVNVHYGTTLELQFSQDNSTWYNSTGTEGGHDVLAGGMRNIDLRALSWNRDSFYYRLWFNSNEVESAEINSIVLTYCTVMPNGSGTSEPIDAGSAGKWCSLNWTADQPQGSSIRFQLRNGTTLAELGSAAFTGPGGNNSTYYVEPVSFINSHHNGGRWIQFRVDMESSPSGQSPELNNVTAAFNYLPSLTLGSYYPGYGSADTLFNFTVFYTDLNDAPPAFVEIVIDGLNISMKEGDGNDTVYFDGKEYYYTTKLAPGEHLFHFIASDGELNASSETMGITVNDAVLAGVKISPPQVSLEPGESQVFNAIGFDLNGTSIPITPAWGMNGGGSIDYRGRFTALINGTWTVFANVSGFSGTAKVTVGDGGVEPIPENLRSIRVTSAKKIIRINESLNFTAQGLDSYGNPINITPKWSVNGGGSIDENGVFISGKAGTWTIYANVSVVSGRTTVTVSGGVGVLRTIIINPPLTSVSPGGQVSLEAVGFDENDFPVNITVNWSVDGGGMIDANGTFSVKYFGTWTVYANASGISGKALVKSELGRLEVVAERDLMFVGESQELAVRAFDMNGEPVNVTPKWNTEGMKDQMSKDGIFTATTPGKWPITASFGERLGYAYINVTSPEVPDDTEVEEDKEEDQSLMEDVREKLNRHPQIILFTAVIIVLLLLLILIVTGISKKKKRAKEEEDKNKYSAETRDTTEEGEDLDGGAEWDEEDEVVESEVEEDHNEWEDLESITVHDSWVGGRYGPVKDKEEIEWGVGSFDQFEEDERGRRRRGRYSRSRKRRRKKRKEAKKRKKEREEVFEGSDDVFEIIEDDEIEEPVREIEEEGTDADLEKDEEDIQELEVIVESEEEGDEWGEDHYDEDAGSGIRGDEMGEEGEEIEGEEEDEEEEEIEEEEAIFYDF